LKYFFRVTFDFGLQICFKYFEYR